MNPFVRTFRVGVVLTLACLASACAIRDKTSLDASWAAPERNGAAFRKVLIITVSGNEFVQQDFQDQMAKRLQEKGMNAVASHRYFTRYVPEERERFKASIEATDADGVLVVRTTGVETTSRDAPDYSLYIYPSLVRTAPDYTLTTINAEAALFERKSEKLVWSARTTTQNAGTGDRDAAIAQFAGVLVDAMAKDKLF